MNFKLIIYVLLIPLFFSCGKNSSNYQISNDTEHLELLKKEIGSEKNFIQFKSIMNFDWDSLIILTPYSWPEKVGEKHSIDLSSIERFNIKSRDDINLIVFLKNNKPIRVIEFPRYFGDFSNNEIEIIKKDDANYKIEKTNETSVDGKQWIRLILQ